jgi:thioredoxin reductase
MVENNQENKKKKTLKIDTSKLSSNLSKKLSNVGLSGNESTEKKNNVTVVVKRKHKAPEATNLDNFSKERSDIFNKDDLEHKKKLIKQASRSSLLEQKSNLVKEIEPQEIHAEQVSEEDFANINVNIKEHLEIEKTSEIVITKKKLMKLLLPLIKIM